MVHDFAQGVASLGLALARRVIERAGGSFRIDSEPGRGTLVSIMLRTA